MTAVQFGIVTGDRAPDLSEDGQALATALEACGIESEPVRWRVAQDWESFDALLVRSCWNYYQDASLFDEWLETIDTASVTVYNPVAALRWNKHKFYLDDLAAAGVQTLDTVFVEQSSDRELTQILDSQGWDEAVVKPAVGTSSENVSRVSNDDEHTDYESLRSDGDVLVQRFAPEIATGESSLVFFRGAFSHASRSIPPAGEFRSHHNFGGHNEAYNPPARIVEDTTAVLRTAADVLGLEPDDLLYARVDGIERDGEFCLMELELIEPYLGLQRADAVKRFARAISRTVNQ